MAKRIHRFLVLFLCVLIIVIPMPSSFVNAETVFLLSDEEKAYLNTLKDSPITIAYSYDLVVAEFDGKPYGMIDPIIGILENELGLTVNLIKTGWHDAFVKIESGEADFYGPIAISEARRQLYVTINPFYRSYSKIMTRVNEPVNSMTGMYNREIGLLEGSVISRTMQAYLGPEGKTAYFPTMDDMIDGLKTGKIDAFATVDNAEFEILQNDDIRFEFSIENFHVDQGFISSKEELRPLTVIINRFLNENPEISDMVTALRNEALILHMKERFSGEIARLKQEYDAIPMYANGNLYPLCYTENGEYKGMQVEINQIFEELTGIPVVFAPASNFPDGISSAVEKLRTGECLALVGVYYDIDAWRDETIEYSPFLWQDTIRTYSRNDGVNLTGKTLGTVRFTRDYLGWNNTTGNPPVIYGSREKLIGALKNGGVDAVFIGEMMFNYEYTILKDYSLREVTGLSAEASMHMLYGAQNQDFNRLYNGAMTLHQILMPRSLGEWKSQSDKYKSDYIRLRYTQQRLIFIIVTVFFAMLSALVFLMLKNLRQSKKTIELMRILNERDVLTGIYNRRYMDINLDKAITLLSRSGSPLSVFMIDIDFFKRFNDTYGHGKGDECLKSVANALNECVRREDDFAARYGGEEFAVVLPHTNEEGAIVVAEKIMEAVKNLDIPHEKSECAEYVSISIGITSGIAAHAQSGTDYLNRADEALYISKREGRNRYTFLEFKNGLSQ